MPKATKKKKEKEADFKKAKLKLGKGKKAASNATDTSFKARSIALPSQKPLARALANADEEQAESSSAVPTTASGLTIDDVLVQLRHVNAGVRKESLHHLKEVIVSGISRGVKLGDRHGEVAKVVRAVGGLLSDEDGPVRKNLQEFLKWYLARLPKRALSPYLGLLQLQLSSALSHIFPAIRLDACKTVEILLESHASEVVGNWPNVQTDATAGSSVVPQGSSTVFEGLRLAAGLGGEKGASTQGGFRLTPGSKLVILRAIRTFIVSALPYHSGPRPVSEAASKKAQLGEFAVADLNCLPGGDQWFLEGGDWALRWSAEEQGGSQLENHAVQEGALEELGKTYLVLHSLVIATFMEAAPIAFSPSSPSSDGVALELCAVSVEIMWSLAQALLNHPTFDEHSAAGELRSNFSEFLKRMTAWFPFNRLGQATGLDSDTLFGLALRYAQLACALSPRPPQITLPSTRTARTLGWKQRVCAIEASWKSLNDKYASPADSAAFRMTAEWVEQCLRPSQDALAPAISAQAFSDLLPVVWALLLQPRLQKDTEKSTYLGDTFLANALRQGSTSGKRKASDFFLIHLVDVHEQRFSTEPLLVLPGTAFRAQLQVWFTSIPRTLWEIGGKDAEASEALLRFLLDIGVRGPLRFEAPYSLIDASCFPTMASKLAPFFHHTHPARGGIEGPWTRIASQPTQKLALDMARIWSPFDQSGKLADAVSKVVDSTPWASAYWSHQ